ncbi:MAG: SufS family cysteine desulfurase [Proteobacteria bacterium]|jgi:cysteine desulfurase/selenocysteine lyase|nr:SufS family cysteine desulfurase [Pseudomonadota bacterium]
MSLDIKKVRADFPALTQRPRGKHLVYLDSAASSLKPWPVIERIGHYYSYETSNVHRGAHFLADQATQNFEASREAVRSFINASSTQEIIFTQGTTDSLNLLSSSLGEILIQRGDTILLTEMEHHANIVPWQILADKKGAQIAVVKVQDNGELDLNDLKEHLQKRPRLLAITHCSNTLGTVNPIKQIAQEAHQWGVTVVVDGAQMVAYAPVDVQDLDVDFYVFSGHKLFAETGLGVLYGKKSWLEKMPPYRGGGSMIHQVTFEKTTYNELPFKFEAGTPHISGVISMKPALEYILGLGFPAIAEHETNLLSSATEALKTIPGLRIIGNAPHKVSIISFTIEGLHHSDIGQILDQEGIAVRVGHHCTQPLLQRYGISGSVRASFSVFNHLQDIEKLLEGLKKAKEMLS